MAASWVGLNCPLSMLLLKRSTGCTNSARPTNIPTRQPAMLWLLLRLLSSRQTSRAPGNCKMLKGEVLPMKLYGLSLTIRNLCAFASWISSVNTIGSAAAPVGMCG